MDQRDESIQCINIIIHIKPMYCLLLLDSSTQYIKSMHYYYYMHQVDTLLLLYVLDALLLPYESS